MHKLLSSLTTSYSERWRAFKKNILNKQVLILTLSLFTALTTLNGQELKDESTFEKLTLQVISLPELQNELLTDKFEGQNSIFVQADTEYIGLGRETFSRSSSPPYFIWHIKTLFFYAIDYWLRPTEVTIRENTAHYEFVTCSHQKEPRKYLQGEIDFKLENGIWIISNKKIRESKKPCLGYE